MSQPGSRPVYSTDSGRICPDCARTTSACSCKKGDATGSPLHADGKVRLRRETSGRKGKGVTLVDGLGMDQQALKATAKKLKAHCGSGGSVKDGVIEIQGDQREAIKAWFEKQGYRCKIAGG